MKRAYQQYRQIQTTTAPGIELVLMLYRGAIKFLNAAESALQAADVETSHAKLVRVQDIVRELRASLDLERGGDIAQHLGDLYAYIEDRLVRANLDKDPAPVVEVRGLMQELAAAWETTQKKAAVANPDGPATNGAEH